MDASWLRGAAAAGMLAAAAGVAATPAEGATFVTADADLRAWAMDGEHDAAVAAVGIAVRQVFADAHGDRVIAFALWEALDDFDTRGFDQAYLRYKGRMGAWNLTAGRYLLPYGILPSYSTKRLLAHSIEAETIGVESDNGVMFSGLAGDFDFAVSASEGVGMGRWTDVDKEAFGTARVGWESDLLPDIKPGISVAWGKSAMAAHGMAAGHPVRRKLAAVDLTWTAGSAVVRVEGTAGRRDHEAFQALFAGADYSLLRWLELNADWAATTGHTGGPAAGVTIAVLGAQVRAAYRHAIEKEDHDEVTLQAYLSWSYAR